MTNFPLQPPPDSRPDPIPTPAPPSGQKRAFTGRHMAIIMICFFGTIIAVNLVMARFAVSTFGGTVVDNSYVASQKFNTWLASAEAQERSGWQQSMTLDDERHLILAITRNGAAQTQTRLTARANHPLGLTETIHFDMQPIGGGLWRSAGPLPSGRWLIHTTFWPNENMQAENQIRFRGEVR